MPNISSPAAQDSSSVAMDRPASAQAGASVRRGKPRSAGQNKNGDNAKLVKFLDFVIRWSVYLAVFLIPLWFLPFTLDVLEINKQTLLVVLATIALLAWLGRMMALRQVELKRTVLNLLVLIYLVGYGIICWFSDDRYQSFVGRGALEQFSFLTVLAFVVFYFVISNNIRSLKFLRNMLYAFIGSAALASFMATIQILGGHIFPWDFAQVITFNVTGTIYAFGVFAATALVLINSFILVMSSGGESFCPAGKCGLATKILLVIAAVLQLVYVILLDFWVVWALLIVGSVLLLAFAIVRAGEFKPGFPFILPMLTLVIAILLLIVSLPLNLGLPAEISPSTGASFEIAKYSLQESPLVGSGPGTFNYDYAKFHSEIVNATVFWNVTFDRANTHVFTALATSGLIGLVLWLMLAILVATRGTINLFKDRRPEIWRYILAIDTVFIVSIIARFLYSANLTLEFTFWVFLGILGALLSREWFRTEFKVSPRAALIMTLVFVLVIVGTVSMLYLVGQRYAADVVFAQAIKLDRDQANIDDVLEKISTATRLNRYDDSYLRNLAMAVLVKFNQEVSSEVSQEKAGYIQGLINDMIAVSRAATEINPANYQNWANQGYVYQVLIPFVQGAGDFAVEAYEKAIELSPNNPSSYVELGKVYIAMADLSSPLMQSEDKNAAAEAKARVEGYLGKAEDNLTKAIELKLDYAPAHYQLGMVYDRQGRLDDAINKMEQVALADQTDVGVALQLGILYLRNEEPEKAKNALEWAVKLAPSFSNARWFLATVYEDLGDITAAIAEVEKVLELNPDNQNVKQRLDNLKEFGTSQPPDIPEPVESEGATTEVNPQRPPVELPVENPEPAPAQ